MPQYRVVISFFYSLKCIISYTLLCFFREKSKYKLLQFFGKRFPINVIINVKLIISKYRASDFENYQAFCKRKAKR